MLNIKHVLAFIRKVNQAGTLIAAGGTFLDKEVVVDGNLITPAHRRMSRLLSRKSLIN
ncbi:hypothetical protein [Paenibacillus sp. N3.4]|uniref:hypothetical protein n=1 Tax=Paenibacillus sp. N3.4 TaxID=2603222 RepID=UPI001650A46F|nr:hypothetical protein [Paenibacillus sp. N3.4]